jgi:hypothetical protein
MQPDFCRFRILQTSDKKKKIETLAETGCGLLLGNRNRRS